MKNAYSLWIVLGVTLLAIGSPAQAGSLNEKCPNLAACTKAVSELTGQKYIFDKKAEIFSGATPNLELTKENADEVFSYLLSAEGYTRVPFTEPGTYAIVRMRDARDGPLPVYAADGKTTPEIPDTYDLVQLTYKMNNGEAIEFAARNMRSFMPANSRIIPNEIARSIIVTDTARNVKKLIPMLRDADQKPSAALRAKWEKREQGEREMRGRPHEEEPRPGPGLSPSKKPAS